jgi:hypothetical protein
MIEFLFYSNRQMADVQKRRLELLNEIKRKDRRTQHFVKDKQETTNLVGSHSLNTLIVVVVFFSIVSSNRKIISRYASICPRNKGKF